LEEKEKYSFGKKGNRRIYNLAVKRIGRNGKGTLLAEMGNFNADDTKT